MKQTSIDDKRKNELIGFQCVCGLEFTVDLRNGPAKFTAECPDLECRRLYQVEYLGRVAASAASPNQLKLVQ